MILDILRPGDGKLADLRNTLPVAQEATWRIVVVAIDRSRTLGFWLLLPFLLL